MPSVGALRAVHLLAAILAAVVAALVTVIILRPIAARGPHEPDPRDTLPGAVEHHQERLRALANGGEALTGLGA